MNCGSYRSPTGWMTRQAGRHFTVRSPGNCAVLRMRSRGTIISLPQRRNILSRPTVCGVLSPNTETPTATAPILKAVRESGRILSAAAQIRAKARISAAGYRRVTETGKARAERRRQAETELPQHGFSAGGRLPDPQGHRKPCGRNSAFSSPGSSMTRGSSLRSAVICSRMISTVKSMSGLLPDCGTS